MYNNIKNKTLREVLKNVTLFILVILIVLFIREYVFRVVISNGDSMSPNISHKDVLITSMLPYVFGEPEVGDIVIFPYQENENDKFIKRVVAKGGDEVDLINGVFYINGEKLEDDFNHDITNTGNLIYPYKIPEGTYFCLGDNRNASKDSRFLEVGTMKESDFMGKVLFRIYPFNTAFDDLSKNIDY
ncbi:MAG: signal peptidase I [Lachnospirales bacterium]